MFGWCGARLVDGVIRSNLTGPVSAPGGPSVWWFVLVVAACLTLSLGLWVGARHRARRRQRREPSPEERLRQATIDLLRDAAERIAADGIGPTPTPREPGQGLRPGMDLNEFRALAARRRRRERGAEDRPRTLTGLPRRRSSDADRAQRDDRVAEPVVPEVYDPEPLDT